MMVVGGVMEPSMAVLRTMYLLAHLKSIKTVDGAASA